MKKFRLHLLWIGFLLFVLSLIGGQSLNSSLVAFPKPFGQSYSSIMLTTGILLCVLSMFSSWVVDFMKDSQDEEPGTIILKTISKGVTVVVFIIDLITIFDSD
jgi:hypothetical protein